MDVDNDTPQPAAKSSSPPKAPKNHREKGQANGGKDAQPVVSKELAPPTAAKPFMKVCYGCQSRTHLIADCPSTPYDPRLDTFITPMFLTC